ncbi:gamma-glutamyltransferase [Chitinophaga rhizosphaerae]|uniref:gamma-glutamyltransferase n=1 Tax=Chitinophaga rhizosphaerae TaxID=1864947 RepID=UPI000F806C4D|nr:gamma-glutamyltransferase [Chitinophaga rhizosphaerae]
MRIFLFPLLLLACLVSVAQQPGPYHYSIRKYMEAKRFAVSSAHPLASEAGAQIMREGGNAVDAAIAVQLALAVVYPAAGNLGGGGFLVARLADGRTVSIDYREKAPAKAHRDMYLDPAGNPVARRSLDGHLAAGVPGTVAGLVASQEFGRLPLSRLVAPAIELAEKGFVITEHEADGLNRLREAFIRLNTRPVAFVKDAPWKPGDTLVQKDLAGTLRRIARKGMKGFYAGETAKLVAEEMKRGGGIITEKDMAAYKAASRKPVEFDFRGHTVISMPLPSSGGIGLQQMLGMVDATHPEQFAFHSPEAVQRMIEAERRAYADRAEFLGDPDFVKVPVAQLTGNAYLRQRIADFTPGKPTPSTGVKAGGPFESTETTHLSVVDAEGNAVAVTTTLNGGYGSKVVVGGAGFLLNNEMDDFSVKPGTPNMYGLLGTEANAIAPGKRMLSSMTPTIVLKNGKPYLVTGTPGGSTIITSMFQTLMNDIVFGLDAQTNVNAPKFHHQWWPDEVRVEKEFPEATRIALEKMGYTLKTGAPWSRTELIRIENGKIEAVGDWRGDDSVAGE